jgi:hypothetical protein
LLGATTNMKNSVSSAPAGQLAFQVYEVIDSQWSEILIVGRILELIETHHFKGCLFLNAQTEFIWYENFDFICLNPIFWLYQSLSRSK